MAKNSLTDVTSIIKHYIDAQELLHDHLSKLHAMAFCAASDNYFLDNEKSIINSYLWVLCDFAETAKELTEESINFLLEKTAESEIQHQTDHE